MRSALPRAGCDLDWRVTASVSSSAVRGGREGKQQRWKRCRVQDLQARTGDPDETRGLHWGPQAGPGQVGLGGRGGSRRDEGITQR